MSRDRLQQTLLDAIASGLLPSTAGRPVQDSRPWPVVLLTALGAWLAAIPLLGVVGILLGDVISRGSGPYVVGLSALSTAVVILRMRDLPLFVEQLAVPGILVGGGSLAFGLFRHLPHQMAAAVLALIAIFVACAIGRAWLRVLLGAAAAGLTMLALLPEHWDFFRRSDAARFGWALHAVFALWLVAGWVQRNLLNGGTRARQAAALESLAVGWLLITLAGLAFWSGMTLLVSASFGGDIVGDVANELVRSSAPPGEGLLLQTTSLMLALGAAAWLAHRWPAMRQLWCGAVAAVLIGLSWFMPSLGPVLLALAICSSSGRPLAGAAAGLAAAWIIGAFYYQLNWSLAYKAMVLASAGIVLAALAWFGARKVSILPNAAPRTAAAVPPTIRAVQAGIALCALLVLAVVNVGIWQKEGLIAHGQQVFVELAPVDPRSLMQGDYMRLNFRVPDDVSIQLKGARVLVIARRDARGVATLLRLANGQPLGPGEFLFELTPKDGRWMLVSDAWFFKEGEGARWAQARYGEFRLETDGRALLVGLRGADLQTL
jgi:uncharacterized membrane-anchored protein